MLYIVIPTYNERENIEELIKKICEQNLPSFKILIVDDNSPDETAELINSLKNEYPLELILRPKKMGLGSAYVTGFKKALKQEAKMIIEMDADFSHHPYKIPELLKAVEQGADVSLGSRRIKNGSIIGWSFKRKMMSGLAMEFSRLILGLKTKDITGGFRCFHRRVFEKIDLDQIKSNGYAFQEEMIYLLEKNNFQIKEVPITFVDRQKGKSKLGWKEIFSFFITICRLKLKI